MFSEYGIRLSSVAMPLVNPHQRPSILAKKSEFKQLEDAQIQCAQNLALGEESHKKQVEDLDWEKWLLEISRHQYGHYFPDQVARLKEIEKSRATSFEGLEKLQQQLERACEVLEAARPAYTKLCENTAIEARQLGF